MHFDTNLCDLDLDSRAQCGEKGKTSEPFTSQSFEWISMEFDMLLRLNGLVKLISIQREKPAQVISSKKLEHLLAFRHVLTNFFQT